MSAPPPIIQCVKCGFRNGSPKLVRRLMRYDPYYDELVHAGTSGVCVDREACYERGLKKILKDAGE